MDTPYLLVIGACGLAGVGLLIYVVRDQQRARKDRAALARDLAELREQLRERYGHQRAEELMAEAGIPQQQSNAAPPPEQPSNGKKRRRHLKAVPPLAAVGVATEWVRQHPAQAAVGVLSVAAALALTASAPWHAGQHHHSRPPAVALPAPRRETTPPAPPPPTSSPAPAPPNPPAPTTEAPAPGGPGTAAPMPVEPVTEPIAPSPRSAPAPTTRPTMTSPPPASTPGPTPAARACQGVDVNLRPVAALCLLG